MTNTLKCLICDRQAEVVYTLETNGNKLGGCPSHKDVVKMGYLLLRGNNVELFEAFVKRHKDAELEKEGKKGLENISI